MFIYFRLSGHTTSSGDHYQSVSDVWWAETGCRRRDGHHPDPEGRGCIRATSHWSHNALWLVNTVRAGSHDFDGGQWMLMKGVNTKDTTVTSVDHSLTVCQFYSDQCQWSETGKSVHVLWYIVILTWQHIGGAVTRRRDEACLLEFLCQCNKPVTPGAQQGKVLFRKTTCEECRLGQ